MKFNSQICTTKEQSERLLSFGLKAETADMCINPSRELVYPFSYCEALTLYDNYGLGKIMETDLLHAWSLHRLIEMMPNEIIYEDYSLILALSSNSVYYADNEYAEMFKCFDGNLYKCVIKCIEWLIKEGYFNKEYLEE